MKEPIRSEIALNVRRVNSYTPAQEVILCKNVCEELRKRGLFPAAIKQFNDPSVRMDFCEDRFFCEEAGIPYHLADKYLNKVRAAIALWFYDVMH